MSNAYYEIVELENGEIALQRIGGDGEPLVRISFSDEIRFYLQEEYVDVAKAMINTGIRIVGKIQDDDRETSSETDEQADQEEDAPRPTLH